MKKTFRITAVLIAVLIMLPFFTLTARAEPVDTTEDDIIVEETTSLTETSEPIEILEPTEITFEVPLVPIIDFPIADYLITDYPTTDYPETPPQPFTPAGTGTVADYATDSDGKEFYTITTPNENVFYLVIDRQRSQENVYFLNAVTESDLIALAQKPETPALSQGYPAPIHDLAELESEQEPEPTPVTEQSGGNMGMIILVVVVVAVGGGAGWYLKIYRPKQQCAGSEDEYEPPIDDSDNEYTEEWGDNQDDADDNPPWDVDEAGDVGDDSENNDNGDET